MYTISICYGMISSNCGTYISCFIFFDQICCSDPGDWKLAKEKGIESILGNMC